MKQESRTKKAFLNAKISMICYIVGTIIAFFTRSIFLKYLGENFLGLTGTLQSLLGFLNIAELGVGTAIAVVLYEPLYKSDKDKIKEIVAVLQFLYQCIGCFILLGGIILSLFIPMIFKEAPISLPVIYFGFYAYLTSSLVGYFVNYRATLLSADQKNYLVTGYYQLATTAKAIIQMVLAIYIRNFYLYLAIELTFAIINSVILNWKINKIYPWLEIKKYNGRKLLKKYSIIGVKIQQLMLHRIGAFVQFQVMPFMIYSFVSMPMVALYGNYSMVSQRIEGLINSMTTGLIAGIGNLIAEGNKKKILSLYRELLVSRICIAGIIALCFNYLLSPLIIVWLGKQYQLNSTFVLLLSFLSFLNLSRSTTDSFINGYGIFGDVWAPFCEAAIYISAALVLGPIYGLNGLLFSPIVSMILVVFCWKPYWLFKHGFELPLKLYWGMFIKYTIPIVITYFISPIVFDLMSITYQLSLNWWTLIVGSLIYLIIVSILVVGLEYIISPDMRHFILRFIKVKNTH